MAIVVIVIIIVVLVVVYVRRRRAPKLKSSGISGTHIVRNEQEIVPGMKVCKHVQYTGKTFNRSFVKPLFTNGSSH